MYCRRCLYNLANLTEPRCPECGQGFDPGDAKTYLRSQYRGLPLLPAGASIRLSAWCARHKALAVVLYLVMQLGVRAAGASFLTMPFLIGVIEGESGRGRTHWDAVIVMGVVIGFGFYITHALIPLISRAGVPDPIRLWSYLLGVLLTLLIFGSPLRP